MNLKRLRGIAAVAFTTIAAALLAGCMNSMAGSVDGGASRGIATLHFSTTGIPEEYAKEYQAYNDRLNARSILPNDPFKIENGLSFVLTGKNEAGNKYGPKEVTLKTGTADADGGYDFVLVDGNLPVTMDAMSWVLTLTAYKTEGDTYDADKPVLIGYCSVDLRNGSGTAKFKMGIAGLNTPAGVTISGDVIDRDNLAGYCTAGIYRKIDLKDVDTTEQEVTLDAPVGNKKSFTFTAASVTPGIYLYIMKFYEDSTKAEIVGSYTDTIVINPGNDLTKTGLTIDVIGRKATEPKNLKAAIVPGPDPSDGSTYNVKVTWDEGDYVTNYELNLVESASDGTDFVVDTPSGLIKDGQIYGMASMDKTTPTKIVKDFSGSDVFGKDSSPMVYGDTSCVLKLETGKVYEIQLRARNYYGTSDWVNRVASDDTTNGYKAPDDQRINRMYVAYDLNGGKLRLGNEGTDRSDKYYVVYSCWISNQDLLVIGEGSGANQLKNAAGVNFESWLLEEGTAVKVVDGDDAEISTRGDVVTRYTYKNVKVKASYGNKVTGSVTQEDEIQDVDKDDIAYTLMDSTGASMGAMEADPDGENLIAKKLDANGKTTSIEILLNNAAEDLSNTSTKYTNVKVEAWERDYNTAEVIDMDDSVYGKFNVSTAKYHAGNVLSIKVTADTKTTKGVSQTLTFRLQ